MYRWSSHLSVRLAGSSSRRLAPLTMPGYVDRIAAPTDRRYLSQSFIDRAAKHGAQSLLGQFPAYMGRFDQVLKHVHVDKMEPGLVQVSFEVDESHANGYGTLHGGFTATLVDVVGTLALISKDKDRAGVSLDINVTYLNAAKIGEKVICIGKLLKMGNSFGFTEVEIKRASDGKLLATGRHTKAFPGSSSAKAQPSS